MSGKFTVSLRAPFASNWSKGQYDSLTSALSGAWRKRNKDFSVDNVSYEQKVIIDHEALGQAFAEMDHLSRERPKCQAYELAEQALLKLDTAITQNELWERMDFIKAVYAKGARQG